MVRVTTFLLTAWIGFILEMLNKEASAVLASEASYFDGGGFVPNPAILDRNKH
jgi:hypothetical protein